MEAIGINPSGLIAQIVNFAIIFLLLRLLLFKPITGMLERRRNAIAESMERAEEIKRQATQAEQEYQRRLEEARREGQAIVAQANQIGERLREEARQEAIREAEAILVKARAEIALERDRAVAEVRRQFADLTVLAASRVINQALDREAHRRLIDEVLEESTRLSYN